MAPWTFLITLALTLYMVGMIWSMQALEYPLFAYVRPAEFPAYHARHDRALPLLVILPSLLALLSAVLVIWSLPADVPLCPRDAQRVTARRRYDMDRFHQLFRTNRFPIQSST
jgi:hypothetical protein